MSGKDKDFTFTEWNPSDFIDTYAEKEAEVRKMKAVMDEYAKMYGMSALGL